MSAATTTDAEEGSGTRVRISSSSSVGRGILGRSYCRPGRPANVVLPVEPRMKRQRGSPPVPMWRIVLCTALHPDSFRRQGHRLSAIGDRVIGDLYSRLE